MNYRDTILPGKFRDAPFSLDSHQVTGGRRTIVHEYPLRDVPYAEDMGRAVKPFILQCYVVGDEYHLARDALITALDAPGPGVLIHPYLGTLNVQVETYQVTENARQGRRAIFSITFSEAGQNALPDIRTNTRDVVKGRAAEVKEAINADVTESFSLTSRAAFIVESVTDTLNSATALIGHAVQYANEASAKINAVKRDILAFTGSISSLILAPAKLAIDFGALTGAINGIVTTASLAPDLYRQLIKFGDNSPSISRTTGNRVVQSNAVGAIYRMAQFNALADMAIAVSDESYTTRTQGRARLDEMLANIERMLLASQPDGSPISDNLFEALANLKAALVNDILARSANLTRLITITTTRTVPALVLSHELYQTIEQADVIVQANGVRRPGFIVGGSALEVVNAAA